MSLLQPIHKLLLFVLFLSIFTILVSYFVSGIGLSILSMIFILFFLSFTKSIWLPYRSGKDRVRTYSIYATVLSSLPFLYPSFNDYITSIFLSPLLSYMASKYDFMSGFKIPDGTPSSIVIPFILTTVFIVNYFMRDKTVMGKHPGEIDKEFPERNYNTKLTSFCRTLKNDLNRIDNETNWSAELFTPLEAEVEVKSGNRKKKKVTDLLKAIRSDKQSKVFLILGDPGSGKSVSLRKLCSDMLDEVESTGRIPIYINLREWVTKNCWSEENPPKSAELYEFIVDNLKSRLDIFGNEFIDHYFKKMFENGRLFIVLDSFDEIPSVLDVDESSWLINELSSIIYTLLAGSHESRGILSSRIFRKPSDSFQTNSTLEIRPFTDLKIINALNKAVKFDDILISKIFKDRQEFISMARNPFTTALISSYSSDNNGDLPQKQSDLYSSYIYKRLQSSSDRLTKRGLSVPDVIKCASDIALTMFKNQQYGLGAPVDELAKLLPQHKVNEIVDILSYVRLGRVGGTDERLFSFSHRRFNEYFVAIMFMEDKSLVTTNGIPTDSRWRDALVMYCEVANDKDVIEIANYCWSEIKNFNQGSLNSGDNKHLRAIHCLRFLKDAFRSRKDCLSGFIVQLKDLILNQVTKNDNIVTKKIAVEAVGLLNEKDIDEIITHAIKIKSSWVQDEAFKSCRHLRKITKKLYSNVFDYIFSLSDLEIIKRNAELNFSLSLSEAFSKLHKTLTLKILSIYAFIAGVILASAIIPEIIPIIILIIILSKLTLTFNSNLRTRSLLSLFKFQIISIIFMLFTLPITSPLESTKIFSTISFISYIDNTYITNAIISITLILIFPFVELIMTIRNISKIKLSKEFFSVLFTFAVIILATIYITFNYVEYFKIFINSSITRTVIIGTALILPIRLLYKRYSDFNLLKKHSHSKSIDRKDLVVFKSNLETSWGELEFLSSLDAERTSFTGVWPLNIFPKCKTDASTSLLAKIEEKSLGLS